MIEADAVNLLAAKLRIPLQIEMHRELAFEAAYRGGARPVPLEIVDRVLSRAIDDLEPRLIRNGYDADTMAREFGAKPAEIRTFLAGTLGVERTRELTDQMRVAGGRCERDLKFVLGRLRPLERDGFSGNRWGFPEGL